MSLQRKTISGLFWTFSQQFSVQIINFIVQIVLARILIPSDFGLIAMLTVFINVGNSLMDSGLTSSLIRTPKADQGDYSTVFYINILGSLVVYLMLFFSAPFIALFYKQELLVNIIRVYTLSFIIRAFVSVQTTRLTKEMNFKLQMTMQIPSIFIGGIVGIYLASKGYGVWSLVWLNLTQSFLFTVQHWVRSGWYPSLIFDREKLKQHFLFGYKLTLSGLLNTIYQNLYNLIIGKYFSAAQLGFYNRADTFRMLPVQNIATALNKVTYPMFATIQDDNRKLKAAYEKLMTQVLFWLTPIMILLSVMAKPLFILLLTAKWLEAVPYFQILCFAGIMYPLHSYNLNILKVKGRSDLFLRLEIIKKVIITIGIAFSVSFGIYGLLYFQLISSVLSFYINSIYSGDLIDYSIKQQLRDILPIFGIAGLTGGMLWGMNIYLFENSRLSNLVILFTSGIAYFSIYLLASYFMKIPALFDFKKLVLKK